MKYAEWAYIWLDNYVKPTVKYKTLERYRSIINRLNDGIGNYEVSEIKPINIQQFISRLLINGNLIKGNGLNNSTVNMIITIFMQSMKIAYMLGITNEIFEKKIIRPKNLQKEIHCFTLDEQRKIENYVLNSDKTKLYGIILCLYTGIRIGELLALQWDNVDFKKKTIAIKYSCYDGKNEKGNVIRVLASPKTPTSNRIIPIPNKLIGLLAKLKKTSKSVFVISENDKEFSIRSYQRTFELLLKKLEIKHHGFHSLRHTFATRALEIGMDVKTLSEILGHKNSLITLNRYAHSMMEHKIKMMNQIGALL